MLRTRVPNIGFLEPAPLTVPELEFIGNNTVTSATLTGADIGTPDPMRNVVISVVSGTPLADVTIGGQCTVELANIAAGQVYLSVWVARVPEGTTADIAFGGYASLGQCTVYTINCTESPDEILAAGVIDTDSGTADPLNLSTTTSTAGATLVAGLCQNGNRGTITGDLDTLDVNLDAASNEWYVVGHGNDKDGSLSAQVAGFGVTTSAAVLIGFPVRNLSIEEQGATFTHMGGCNQLGTTKTNIPIGKPDPNRLVGIAFSDITTGNEFTSVTIGGIAATQVVSATSPTSIASQWVAKVPTGSVADVVVNRTSIECVTDSFVTYTTDSAATVAANALTDSDSGLTAYTLSVNPTQSSEIIGLLTMANGTEPATTGLDNIIRTIDIRSNEWITIGTSTEKTGIQTVNYTNVGSTDSCCVLVAYELTAPVTGSSVEVSAADEADIASITLTAPAISQVTVTAADEADIASITLIAPPERLLAVSALDEADIASITLTAPEGTTLSVSALDEADIASITLTAPPGLSAAISAIDEADIASISLQRQLQVSISATDEADIAVIKVDSVAWAAYVEIASRALLGAVTSCPGPEGTLLVAGSEGRALVYINWQDPQSLSFSVKEGLPGRPLAIASDVLYFYVLIEGIDQRPRLRIYPMSTIGAEHVAEIELDWEVEARFLWAANNGPDQHADFVVITGADGAVQVRSASPSFDLLAEMGTGIYTPRVVEVVRQQDKDVLEPDNYTLVWHIMVFSERSARGVVLEYKDQTATDTLITPSEGVNVSISAQMPHFPATSHRDTRFTYFTGSATTTGQAIPDGTGNGNDGVFSSANGGTYNAGLFEGEARLDSNSSTAGVSPDLGPAGGVTNLEFDTEIILNDFSVSGGLSHFIVSGPLDLRLQIPAGAPREYTLSAQVGVDNFVLETGALDGTTFTDSWRLKIVDLGPSKNIELYRNSSLVQTFTGYTGDDFWTAGGFLALKKYNTTTTEYLTINVSDVQGYNEL